MVYSGYCSILQIKERLLIPSGDITYDDDLESAGTEGSRLIDIYLTPYTTVPLESPPEQVKYICADFAASIFKRRMLPNEVKIQGQLTPEGMNQIEASGWWGIALKKLEDYIKNTYHLADKSFAWTSCKDPDLVLRALDRRAIGIAEARAILKAMTYDPTSKTEAEIDLIEKQIELIDAQIAKMVQDGLLVETETTKLAGADTNKIVAETSKIGKEEDALDAEILNIPKQGLKTDAETTLLGSQKDKMDKETEQLETRTFSEDVSSMKDETEEFQRVQKNAKVVFPKDVEEE